MFPSLVPPYCSFRDVVQCTDSCALRQAGYSIETQVQALGQKYLGSSRPESRADVIFNSQPPKSDGIHPVPVTNFMNAQCEFPSLIAKSV